MKNKLKILGLTTLLAFGNCPSFQNTLPENEFRAKELNFEEQYGTSLILEAFGDYLVIKYNRDFDDYDDLKLFYSITKSDGKNVYLELEMIMDDKNRNRIYDEDERRTLTKSEKEIMRESTNLEDISYEIK